MKTVWYRKADKDIIVQEKQAFNKALQVESFDGILDILQKPLTSFDKQTDYQFELVSEGKSLSFEL